MKKYLSIIATTFKEYSIYRLNFLLWRFRAFLNLLIVYFLWEAAFSSNKLSFSQKAHFFSYLIYAATIAYLVLGTRTTDIAEEINSGKIINTLLKPISFFKFHLTRDFADKLINLFFAFFEAALVVALFKIPLLFPQNIFFGLIFLINGIFISFFINLLLSFIGFWTRETWAPRFLFILLISFLSGSYFPLNILPKPIFEFLMITPFPYLYYLPTKIFLGEKINLLYAFFSFFWMFFLYFLTKKVFEFGLKSFSFWGR